MDGYNIIHEVTFFQVVWYIAFIMALAGWVLTLIIEGLSKDDWLFASPKKVVTNTTHQRTLFDRLLNTDSYHKKEKNVAIPVLYYVKVAGEWREVLTNTIDAPPNVNWHGDGFAWSWVKDKRSMGWVQEGPPAEMTLIASEGMMKHVNRILNIEAPVEIISKQVRKTQVVASLPSKTVEIKEIDLKRQQRTSKSIEIDQNNNNMR